MTFRTNGKRSAFTLIESLVVMLTIILLATVVIPGLMGKGGREPEMPKLPKVEQAPVPVEESPPIPSPAVLPVPKPVEELPTSPVAAGD